MADVVVTDLFIYPVKSCAPLRVSRAWVGPQGLDADRRYMVTDPAGQFITARRYPALTHLLATPVGAGLMLAAEGFPALQLQPADFPEVYQDVVVWKQTVAAQSCGASANAWISHFLGIDCQLVYFGQQSQRPVKDCDDAQVGFADGYPLLLTSEASLDWLQTRCPVPVDKQQFRANLVVSGSLPFAEDGWLDIAIGDVRLRAHAPCERCKLITLPPGSREFDQTQEPLRTLLAHRRLEQGGAIFGQNLLVLQPGLIATGMKLEVLSNKAPPVLRGS